MTYFFILGSNPTLSFAELVAVLDITPENVALLTKQVAVVAYAKELDIRTLMRRLGGTIKAGTIRTTVDANECTPELAADLISNKATQSEGKFSFGFSFYGKTAVNKKTFGMEVKRLLKEQGVSPRWVVSKEKHLSSVVVEQNRLTTERGSELVFVPTAEGDEMLIGETIAVQPFKELSKRDYGRPGRDDYSGMLPPKLAQMMINLSGVDSEDTLLDPFCGSGTVLMEAGLMGVQSLIGTDSSKRAIKDSQKNWEWAQERYHQLADVICRLSVTDVRELSRSIKKNSVDVIVTEPYLGPSRMARDRGAIQKVKRELEELYAQALAEFEKILKPGGRVVMVWPVFRVGNGKKVWLDEQILLKHSSFYITNVLQQFTKSEVVQWHERKTLLYARQGQHVEREIVALQKK